MLFDYYVPNNSRRFDKSVFREVLEDTWGVKDNDVITKHFNALDQDKNNEVSEAEMHAFLKDVMANGGNLPTLA